MSTTPPLPEPRPRFYQHRHFRLLAEAVRLALVLLFAISGLLKLYDPASFALQLSQYQDIPAFLVQIAPYTVPVAEVAAAILLWLRSPWGTGLSGLLTLTFMAVILPNWGKTFEDGCGCFGPASGAETVGWPHLLLLGSMLLGTAIVGMGLHTPPPVADNHKDDEPTAEGTR